MQNAYKPDPLTVRLRDGFDRIAFVLRSDLWSAASASGLNAAQAQVLGLLANRPLGLRPKEIAAHLAVTSASIADTLNALTRKGLVKREADPADGRAAIITATPDGSRAGVEISEAESKIAQALAGLSPAMQEELLLTQIALIRQLLSAGAIPLQRMCVSCRYFRPHAHPDGPKPHHCAFVNAAIDGRELRLDCGEHEAAAPDVQATTWMSFAKGSPSLQAQPSN